MTNLDSILKSRDIILPTKVHLVKAMVFLVVMHGCENWTLKKAEHWRIDAFELWCWKRLLRVPWTARRSNQSILKEISPKYSLEGLTLKLKLQYLGHLIRRADLLKDPDAGKDWRQGEKGTTEDEMFGWHHWLNGHEFEQALGDGEGQGSLVCCPWSCKERLNTVLMCVCSVVSDSLWPHRLQPTGLLCPWDFPGKNTGVGCCFSLQAPV